MQQILRRMSLADYEFLVGLINSGPSLVRGAALQEKLNALKESSSGEAVAELCLLLEKEIRYLGSADGAYLARKALGQTPGVSFEAMIEDAAKALKVSLPVFCDEEAKLTELVKAHVGNHFAGLEPEKQRKVLLGIGVPQEEINAFFRRSALRISLPLLLQTFGSTVAQKLVAELALGAIAGFLGRGVAKQLLQEVMKKFPLWSRWLGPASWALSLGWTAAELQGPALRKTIPIILYLGLVLLRTDEQGD